MLIYISGDSIDSSKKENENDEPYSCGVATNVASFPPLLKTKPAQNPLLYASQNLLFFINNQRKTYFYYLWFTQMLIFFSFSLDMLHSFKLIAYINLIVFDLVFFGGF